MQTSTTSTAIAVIADCTVHNVRYSYRPLSGTAMVSMHIYSFLFAQYWRWHSSALETFVPVRSINLLFTLRYIIYRHAVRVAINKMMQLTQISHTNQTGNCHSWDIHGNIHSAHPPWLMQHPWHRKHQSAAAHHTATQAPDKHHFNTLVKLLSNGFLEVTYWQYWQTFLPLANTSP